MLKKIYISGVAVAATAFTSLRAPAAPKNSVYVNGRSFSSLSVSYISTDDVLIFVDMFRNRHFIFTALMKGWSSPPSDGSEGSLDRSRAGMANVDSTRASVHIQQEN